MDILAHGLWAGGLARAFQKRNREIKPGWIAFWGVFPDLFAFTLLFGYLIAGRVFGFAIPHFPSPNSMEPIGANGIWLLKITPILYSLSHSVVIFVIVLGVVLFMRKRIPWSLFGWFLHIVIDVPTHSYEFYPTPVLWPISDWRFNGVSWGVPWFSIANYSLLAMIYLAFLFQRAFNKKTNRTRS